MKRKDSTTKKDWSTKDEFQSPFWDDGYRINLAKAVWPLAVAQFTFSNSRVDADPKKFRETAEKTARKFVKLMSEI